MSRLLCARCHERAVSAPCLCKHHDLCTVCYSDALCTTYGQWPPCFVLGASQCPGCNLCAPVTPVAEAPTGPPVADAAASAAPDNTRDPDEAAPVSFEYAYDTEEDSDTSSVATSSMPMRTNSAALAAAAAAAPAPPAAQEPCVTSPSRLAGGTKRSRALVAASSSGGNNSTGGAQLDIEALRAQLIDRAHVLRRARRARRRIDTSEGMLEIDHTDIGPDGGVINQRKLYVPIAELTGAQRGAIQYWPHHRQSPVLDPCQKTCDTRFTTFERAIMTPRMQRAATLRARIQQSVRALHEDVHSVVVRARTLPPGHALHNVPVTKRITVVRRVTDAFPH